MSDNAFRLHETEGIAYYTCRALEKIHNLSHGFSTRHGGLSSLPSNSLNLGHVPWDGREHVEENRRRFLDALQISPDWLTTLSQKHSADFHIISAKAPQWNGTTPGDALITKSKEVALAVLVADCFPILAADPETGAIACIHSGWRGTLGRILLRTLRGMERFLSCDPERLMVAIGPGIRSCCMEVGAEVAASFDREYGNSDLLLHPARRPEKHLLDLPLALHQQLRTAGVPPENVFDLGLCTHCNTGEFFSHRAECERTGRMMAVICTRKS